MRYELHVVQGNFRTKRWRIVFRIVGQDGPGEVIWETRRKKKAEDLVACALAVSDAEQAHKHKEE